MFRQQKQIKNSCRSSNKSASPDLAAGV